VRHAEIIARRADREVQTLANRGVRAMGGVARNLRVAALKAYRTGEPMASVIRRELGPLQETIRQGMVAADESGRLRSEIQNKAAVGLSTTFDTVVETLQARLGMSTIQLERIQAVYSTEAATITGDIGSVLEQRVGAAVQQAIQTGVHRRGGEQLIREAFNAAGVMPDNPYLLETVYRTELQKAYSAGRWVHNQQPAIQEILWGYEYVSVMDDRTTELCERLDGTRKPTGDPFWNTFSSPNHFGCRGQIVEIYRDEDDLARATQTPDLSNIERFPAFEFNPGVVYGV
jgi:SPP1 gp7 family putative phage head morphogenesis protein